MKVSLDMTKTISASDAQARLGSMLKWVEENRDGVIIERRGKPAGVLISYDEYERVEKLRKQEAGRQALMALRALRKEVQANNADLSTEEAYRLAGFSEEAVQSTLEKDKELMQAEQ